MGPWFHNMNIGGLWTAPHHPLGDYPALKWRRFAPKVAGLVAGRSVLDIGCNGGFYSIEMKRLGRHASWAWIQIPYISIKRGLLPG